MKIRQDPRRRRWLHGPAAGTPGSFGRSGSHGLAPGRRRADHMKVQKSTAKRLFASTVVGQRCGRLVRVA